MHTLSAKNLSFSYDGRTPTLRNVSFDVGSGEFLSIIGPNGSGKSTLLRLLDRILLPQQGSITLDDNDINFFHRQELARRIAFVSQEIGTLFPFTVMEMVLMGRAPHARGSLFENEQDRSMAAAMMERMDIAHLADHPVTALSGGEKQRVFIARALAQQPGILLLDEPNAHLDIAHQIEVFTILRTLIRESGLTVISVSHDLNLAGAFSNRIAMLVCGTLVAIGSPLEVLTEERIKSVFGTAVIVDSHPVESTARVTLLTS